MCSYVKVGRDELAHVNLVNKDNNTFMHIEVERGVLKINDRYHISDDTIETTVHNTGVPRNMNKLVLKVQNVNDLFSVNVHAQNSLYTFEVNSTMVAFVDPMLSRIRASGKLLFKIIYFYFNFKMIH